MIEMCLFVEIECVQNDRNVFICRDRKSVCVSKDRHKTKRTATG